MRSFTAVCAGSLLLYACIGHIGDGGEAVGPSSGIDADKYGGWSPPAMWRLTTEQYASSVRDVFGSAIELTKALEEDETTELFLSMGAAKVGTSEYGVEKYHNAAIDLAVQVIDNQSAYPLIDACAPFQPGDPCIREAIAHYGRLLWRRALNAAELDRVTAVVGASGDSDPAVWRLGMTFAIAALLDSPRFIYLPMVGEPVGEEWRYTSQEMASRLSYTLWGSTPDEELLRAAEAGELVSRDQVRAQAERMLQMPRANALATRFFGEAWLVSRLEPSDKSTDAFPEWTPELLEGYLEEFDAWLRDLVERDGDILEIFAPVDGLLTSGAVMSAVSKSDRTSPTLRGVFVIERLLCGEVPAPPANVNDVIEPPTVEEGLTLKEKLAQHREDPACAGCHDHIDPLGFVFENYDGIGKWRETENGKPVDATGEYDSQILDGVGDLVDLLVADPRLLSCLAERLYTFAAAHEPSGAESYVLEGVSDALRGHHRFQQLMVDVVSSGAFRHLEPSE